MGKLISKLIEWGLVLAVAGQLKGATLAILKHAARAHREGVVSLGEINRAIMTRPRANKPVPPNNGQAIPAAKN